MNMNSIERGLERFLRLHLSKSRSTPLHRFVLRHAAPGSKGQEVESFDAPESLTADTLPMVMGEILQRAQEDADGNGGVQRYMLHMYEQENSKSVARYAFRLRGAEEDGYDDSAGEESPTMKGLLTQLMRHNEANTRTMNVGFGSIMSHLVRRLESADRQVEKLMEQRSRDFQALEESMSTQHDRDMQLLLTEGSEKRKDQMFAKLSLLLPVVLNKLAGQKVFDAEDPGAMMLKEFVSSLNDDQMREIFSKLKPEQAITLATLMKSLQQPKQIEESKLEVVK